MGQLQRETSEAFEKRILVQSIPITLSSLAEKESEILINWLLGYEHSTRLIYKGIIEAFFAENINKSIKDITFQDINNYLYVSKRNLKPKTKENIRNCLHSVFKLFKSMNYIEIQPVELTKKVKVKSESLLKKSFTVNEIELLIHTAKDLKYKLMIEFLFVTGLRISECLNVRWNSLQVRDDRVDFFVVGKGSKDRDISIRIDLYERLLELKKEDSIYIFESAKEFTNKKDSITGKVERIKTDRKLSRNGAWRAISKIAAKAGFAGNNGPHKLRHSLGREMAENNVNVMSIMKAFGHSDPKTSHIYTSSAEFSFPGLSIDLNSKKKY